MSCDLKLAGGQVIDGTGAPRFAADIALSAGRISAIGDLEALEARETLDCTGRIIAPGFIDLHSHSDWLVPGADCGALVEPFLRQGMTTIVGGNCGFSPAPVTDCNHDALQSASRLIVDNELDLQWRNMDEFLGALEQTPLPLNVAELVGHGAIRAGVTGNLNPEDPTGSELAEMERHTREALDAGCVGISTGLGYPPGIFAKPPELTAYAQWAADAGKLFTSHVRAYSRVSPVFQSDPAEIPHNIQALQEVIDVARAADVRLQLSHLIFVGRKTWPTCERAIACIEEARAGGLDVAFDAFPYTAGNTTASVLFPPEMLPHLESMLQSPDAMNGMRSLGNSVFSQIGFFLEDIQIMNANAAAFEQYNGLFIGEAAKCAGLDIWEFYARLVVDSQRNARVLNHTYSGHDGEEDALRSVLAHPLCSIETDTFLTNEGHQNPASYGTFPRVLATYVREGLFTLEEAVRKMTGGAADRLGWIERGRIHDGAAADLVVFDPAALADNATFDEPDRFPTGIERVLVNGIQVVDHDRYDANAGAGQVLRG
ncbi:MAG: D-aminoacylase [Deltaproteobacteria bacterium]|nr:D-aminoacylase [Deltaproteobacteria bacterium]MBW2399431.1 D-aminoacylase [Deltaproteobacteria bacterium]MBW2665487.1 D-aminoacylase [Deltaproteobacteria bacterium]